MSKFANKICDVFRRLCGEYGFVLAAATATEDFVVFVKKITDDVYSYLFVSDDRSGGGNLVVSIWIAPPDSPHDGLNNLNVGYKIRIASAFDIDDAFFLNCEERIRNLLPAFESLSNAVSRELADQKCRSYRRNFYECERRAVAALKKLAVDEADGECSNALNVAKKAATRKASYRAVERACVSAADSLLCRGALAEEDAARFRGDATFLGSCIWGHLYVEALGNLSQTTTTKS